MKGILLISHGPLCKGMYETTQWFLGTEIEQYDYLCLEPDDTPEQYDEKLAEKLAALDSGDGVYVFCDLMGGTPCNRAMLHLGENVEVIAGMNLAMVLQQLGDRLSDTYDLEALVATSKNGVVNTRDLLNSVSDDDE